VFVATASLQDLSKLWLLQAYKGFGKILDFVEANAPLRRNVTIDDVGNAAAFLMSDLAGGITGEITYVDVRL